MMKNILLTAVALLWASAANAFILNGEFNANSYVHTPLAPNAPLNPNSAAIVQELIQNSQGGFSVSVGDYAMPIYIVTNEPTVQIKGARAWDPTFDQWGKTQLEAHLNAVPIPSVFAPATGNDKSALIYRPATNELWELWGAELTGQTTVNSNGETVPEWSAGWGGHMTNVTSNPGYFLEDPRFPGYKWGANATSIAQLGTTITIEEQRRGVINHPLSFATTVTSSDGFVFPAQRGDGWAPGALVKEGMIFRFPASLNLDALGLSPYALMIAKAIQKYGMILTDTSGGGFTSIGAEGQGANSHPGFTSVYWDVGSGILGCGDPPPNNYSCWPDSGHLLAGIPWNQLQVTQPPAR